MVAAPARSCIFVINSSVKSRQSPRGRNGPSTAYPYGIECTRLERQMRRLSTTTIGMMAWSKRVCVLLVVSLLFDLSVCLCDRSVCLGHPGLRFTTYSPRRLLSPPQSYSCSVANGCARVDWLCVRGSYQRRRSSVPSASREGTRSRSLFALRLSGRAPVLTSVVPPPRRVCVDPQLFISSIRHNVLWRTPSWL